MKLIIISFLIFVSTPLVSGPLSGTITVQQIDVWTAHASRELATNWESIGTFTDRLGRSFDVQQGTRCTNDLITVFFDNTNRVFVLKSVSGDVVGEKKIEKTIPSGIWFTNLLVK